MSPPMPSLTLVLGFDASDLDVRKRSGRNRSSGRSAERGHRVHELRGFLRRDAALERDPLDLVILQPLDELGHPEARLRHRRVGDDELLPDDARPRSRAASRAAASGRQAGLRRCGRSADGQTRRAVPRARPTRSGGAARRTAPLGRGYRSTRSESLVPNRLIRVIPHPALADIATQAPIARPESAASPIPNPRIASRQPRTATFHPSSSPARDGAYAARAPCRRGTQCVECGLRSDRPRVPRRRRSAAGASGMAPTTAADGARTSARRRHPRRRECRAPRRAVDRSSPWPAESMCRRKYAKTGTTRSSRIDISSAISVSRVRPLAVVTARSRIADASSLPFITSPCTASRCTSGSLSVSSGISSLSPSEPPNSRSRNAAVRRTSQFGRVHQLLHRLASLRAEAKQDVAQPPARPGVLFGRQHFGERGNHRPCPSRAPAAGTARTSRRRRCADARRRASSSSRGRIARARHGRAACVPGCTIALDRARCSASCHARLELADANEVVGVAR